MYLLRQHGILRFPVISAQMSCTRETSALFYTRLLQSCSACQGHRMNSLTRSKTPARTYSKCNTFRTQDKLSFQSRRFHSFQQLSQFSHHRHGIGNSLVPNESHCLSYVTKRSFGVKISGTENVESMYIPTPTEKCYELMEYIHDSAGLPWWLTVLATTILFRGVVVFPFAVWQQIIFARIENAQPVINTYVEQIKQQLAIVAKEKGWSQRQMAKVFSSEVRLLVSNVHYRNNCSSHKLVYLPFWQAGIWLSLTMAIGQMTGKHPELFSTELDVDVLPALASEGALWFSDLMQTDLALAVLLGLVNVSLVELWSVRRGPLTRTQHYLQNTFRIVAICSIPAAAAMPSAVSLYWLASSLCGLGQLAFLRTPPFRRLVGIPHTPSEMKHPLQEMRAALKARYVKKPF